VGEGAKRVTTVSLMQALYHTRRAIQLFPVSRRPLVTLALGVGLWRSTAEQWPLSP